MPTWLNAPWLKGIWGGVVPHLPRVGIALAILVLGWIVAFVVQKLVFGALRRTTIDDKIASWAGVETGGEHGARVERFIAKTLYYLALAFVLVAFFSYLGITAVTAPLLTVLNDMASAVPNLLKALVIGVLGFLVATGVRRLILGALERIGFEQRMQKLSGEEPPAAAAAEPAPAVEEKKKGKKKRVMVEQPFARTVADIAYWFIIIVAAIPVLDALRVGALAAPLSAAFAAVARYVPRIAAAAVLLVAGYFIAKLSRAAVRTLLERVGVDKAMARIGFGRIAREHRLSGILGTVVMVFVLLHFAISAVGRLDIGEISVPLTAMLDRIYVYLPKLLVAAVLLAIGVVIARVAGNLASRLLAAMGFNTLMVHIGVFERLSADAKLQEDQSKALVERRVRGEPDAAAETTGEEADELLGASGTRGIRTPADIAGVAVAAIVVLLFLRQALGTLELAGLALLLDRFIAFLPNLLVAAVLLGSGLWAGGWARRRIDELTKGSSDRLFRALGPIAHVAVIAFSVMMALQQLGVARQLIAIAFGLVLGAVCLALALAFGLGGRQVAAKILEKEYDRRQRPGE